MFYLDNCLRKPRRDEFRVFACTGLAENLTQNYLRVIPLALARRSASIQPVFSAITS